MGITVQKWSEMGSRERQEKRHSRTLRVRDMSRRRSACSLPAAAARSLVPSKSTDISTGVTVPADGAPSSMPDSSDCWDGLVSASGASCCESGSTIGRAPCEPDPLASESRDPPPLLDRRGGIGSPSAAGGADAAPVLLKTRGAPSSGLCTLATHFFSCRRKERRKRCEPMRLRKPLHTG